ncbi:hypothetical protein FNAPI_2958 [Fusarium napiforme]|uniref:Uncharacterized protein n=1 Tax=Fusarium napiforme TaxID=42672 RepID=A0A8H5NDP9_9HYPO|nr:hypothetical protein FNAPI_2958 [Fusarium napiforme]
MDATLTAGSAKDTRRIESFNPPSLKPRSDFDNADLARKGKGGGTADPLRLFSPRARFLGDRGLSPDTLGIASDCAAASADLDLA